MSRSFSKKARASAKEQGYRSSLEVTLQKFFLANGITFKYETAKIQWEDKRFRKYTPDFILPNGVIIEAKGLFTSEDRRKHKEIKEQHPELEIRFVFENSKRMAEAGELVHIDVQAIADNVVHINQWTKTKGNA
jgi:hypothetical protein